MADIIDLNVYRDQLEAEKLVWRIVKGKCKDCGAEAISVQHQECPLDNVECFKCAKWEWCVTHYVIDDELMPRLELVPDEKG